MACDRNNWSSNRLFHIHRRKFICVHTCYVCMYVYMDKLNIEGRSSVGPTTPMPPCWWWTRLKVSLGPHSSDALCYSSSCGSISHDSLLFFFFFSFFLFFFSVKLPLWYSTAELKSEKNPACFSEKLQWNSNSTD